PMTPFILLSLCDDPALHLKCAASYAAERIPASMRRGRGGARGPRPRERIRLAYLSADFHGHATAYLISELIELHDRARFEVIGISFGREDSSPIRSRLLQAFDDFH